MFSILLAIQVLVSVGIISLVLLQQGKGADMGAGFGSGASGTVFGSRGSGSFLTRATAVLAAVFFINCLLIASPLVRESKTSDASLADRIEQHAVQQNAIEQAVPESATPASAPAASTDLPDLPGEAAAPAAVTPEAAPATQLPAGDGQTRADDLPK